MNREELNEQIDAWGVWVLKENENDRYIQTSRVKSLISKLDEPTHEPVEVEPFMADWLDSIEEREKGKDCLIYELVFAAVEDAEYELDQMEEWIGKNGNIFILADALRYGYVRKPEKQWVVTQDGRYLESVFVGESENANTDFLLDKDKAIKFTDKEKAEAVATLVDGSVEEL